MTASTTGIRCAVVAAWAVLPTVVIADLLADRNVLIPWLVAAPLIAATSVGARHTAAIGSVAVALAVALGWADHIGGTVRHAIGVSTVAAVGVLAVVLAAGRSRREQTLLQARPAVERAARLARSMHAGRMGEWWWERSTDVMRWDAELERLFGLEPGEFGGSFDAWVALIHEDDRAATVQTATVAVARRETFAFDHRCTWRDGSVHWLHALGEVVVGQHGEVVAAAGLAWNVDERHHELDERSRLLEIERAARTRAEYLDRVHEVLNRSVDIAEILDGVTRAAVPHLADWCTAVITQDQPADRPIIVAAHHDDATRAWADDVQRRFPYDPDAPFGVPRVVRTGRREVLRDVSARLPDLDPEARAVLERADVHHVVSVPIVGPLGRLGALQLIRGSERAEFSTSDIDLVEELAARCGNAIHTAILFERQRAGRAALDTLQRVSGGLARAATVAEVASAAIEHGMAGLGADGAVVFGAHPGLVALAARGLEHDAARDPLMQLAARAIHTSTTVCDTVAGPHRHAVVIPMQLLDRSLGALAFTFERQRSLTDEELSMLYTLGSRCGGALERAGLYERDREIALAMQRRLLPRIAALPDWLAAGARYEPATGAQIGGDWYQVLTRDDGRVIASVGDAVGHAMHSAAAMGQLRAAITTAVTNGAEPADALDTVGRFAEQGPDTLAASMMLISLRSDGLLTHASAGHPPAVLVRRDGSSEVLTGGRRPLLGFGSTSRGNGSAARSLVGHGDTLLMYTDGLVERRRQLIDVGIDRLRCAAARMHHLEVQTMCDTLVDELAPPGAIDDDVALLLLRRH